jgi:hypothetical protein
MSKLNIYHVSQNTNNNYDTYSDFVVICEDEETARNTYPTGELIDWNAYLNNYRRSFWAPTKEDVVVRLIGEALPDSECGVVCASFHAG